MSKLIDRFLQKRWSSNDIGKYIGLYDSAYSTHAADFKTRESAASGGSVSAILIYGIKHGFFDGAVVCKSVIENGKVRVHFFIARNENDILDSQGSKYVQTNFLEEAVPLIKGFPGTLAVVGLPCDISNLYKIAESNQNLKFKLKLSIALMCGHNSRTDLIDKIIGKLENKAESTIKAYRFRIGHWRGQLEARFNNGKIIKYPSAYFNTYQNLFFFSERKCMACFDHFGYKADITAGDIWLFKFKNDPIKHTGLIIRTESAKQIFESITGAKELFVDELDIKSILDSQARIAPSHYNVSARSKISKRFNMTIKDTVKEQVSWHAYLNAAITMVNMRLSESEAGKKIIFLIPLPILKLYLYFKKALESLK